MTNVEIAEKKLIKLCRKYGVVIDYNVHFPEFTNRDHSPEIKNAMQVMMKNKMKVLFVLKDAMDAVSESVKADKK
jgi:hypothetical protein